jgi:hypothetical protein
LAFFQHWSAVSNLPLRGREAFRYLIFGTHEHGCPLTMKKKPAKKGAPAARNRTRGGEANAAESAKAASSSAASREREAAKTGSASTKPAGKSGKPAGADVKSASSGVEPQRSAEKPLQTQTKRRLTKSARARKDLKIPPILLEGDVPPPAPAVLAVTGSAARYALGAAGSASRFPTSGGELPETYGTEKLFLAARDPHWLYASWDLALERQREYNRRSRDGHLILRVTGDDQRPEPEIHLNPEARNWFVNVAKAATRYSAELGYYERNGAWKSVSRSSSTFTPPESPSPETSAEFATIPADVTFKQVVEIVREFASAEQPLLEAVIRASEAQAALPPAAPVTSPEPLAPAVAAEPPRPSQGAKSPVHRPAPRQPEKISAKPKSLSRTHAQPPVLPIKITPGKPWTPAQRNALIRLVNVDSRRRVWMGSLEITELVRRQLESEAASIAAAELARKGADEGAGAPVVSLHISSPGGPRAEKHRKFWFKLNAELILYGATEPDARVTIAERKVKLRPDGTFSFRFSLPDGRYQLPASAESADGVETRAASLEFSRSTEYSGEVGQHEQSAELRPPHWENIR